MHHECKQRKIQPFSPRKLCIFVRLFHVAQNHRTHGITQQFWLGSEHRSLISELSSSGTHFQTGFQSCGLIWHTLSRVFIVRSPFRANHHVVVQYMAAGPKCPPTPSPCGPPPLWPDPPCSQTPPHGQTPHGQTPHGQTPPPKDSMTGGGQGGPGRIDEQGIIDDITDAARDFTLQLP